MAKALTAASVADILLGSFGRTVPPSPTIDRLVRLLGTWSGTDKFLGVLEYTLKLLVPFLNFRARLQHQAGMSKVATSTIAPRLSTLATLVTDSRTVSRSWVVLQMIRWLQGLERFPKESRSLLHIERLQAWAMLCFCPLDTLLFLITKGVVPTTISRPAFLGGTEKSAPLVTLNPGKIALWMCRFWASYIGLQLLHLREDYNLLILKERALRRGKTPMTVADKKDLKKRWSALYNDVITNLAYFPLTLHHSVPGGIFTNPVVPTIFGFIGAVGAFRTGWNAAALPDPIPPPAATAAQVAAETSA
ncbi:hypothetical protein DL96DRAFT_1529939 [Flagelloscypha sp. PMI_526]|nr:hypothetical protein DL96DRAFT_1529939 [Flagelloscypha sp. PMI_526]